MNWIKTLFHLHLTVVKWVAITLLGIWLLLILLLQLLTARPNTLYGIADWAGAQLTIGQFASDTQPLATSVQLSLGDIDLVWSSGQLHIDRLEGDVNLWNLLLPDLALGKQMRIEGMRLILVSTDDAPTQRPLANPWLRFWEDTHIHHASIIWQAESPWRLDQLSIQLNKTQDWQAQLEGIWHYPGWAEMPVRATARIEHEFGFNPKAYFSAVLSPKHLLVFGQDYQAQLALTGQWDADAIVADLSLQANQHATESLPAVEAVAESSTGSSQERSTGINKLIGQVKSEDLVNWDIAIQEVQMNGERLSLPVWPRISLNPQQGAKLALHQVRLTAQDRWVSMLPTEMGDLVQQWQPELWMKQLTLQWTPEGKLDTIRGGIDILRWQAQEVLPGADLRDITFAYTPQEGRLHIIPAGTSNLLWQWQNTTPFQLTATPFVLTLDPERPLARWTLPLWHIAVGALQLQLQMTVDTQAKISLHASAPQLSSLTPLLQIPPFSTELKRWLASALVQGEAPQVNLDYQGELTDLLTGNWTEDQLKLTASVQQATLAFDPDYPPLSQMDARISLTPSGLHIQTDQARLGKVNVSQVKADVLYLPNQQVALRINGAYQATLKETKQFLQTTPLAELIGIESLLKQTEFQGNAKGQLSLWIPLDGYPKDTPTRVLGVGYITQGEWDDAQFHITEIDTKLLYTEKRVDIPKLSGKWLGGEVSGRLKQETKGIRLLLSGRHSLDLPHLVQGATDWKAEVKIGNNHLIEVTATGQQNQLARLLPEPLGQPKGVHNDWKLQLTQKEQQVTLNWQDSQWRLSSKLLEHSGNWQVQEATFAPLTRHSQKGTSPAPITVHLPVINFSAWSDWYQRFSATEASTAGAMTLTLPQVGVITADQLVIANQHYDHLQVNWKTDPNLMLNLQAEGLSGVWKTVSDQQHSLHLTKLRWHRPYQTAADKLMSPLPVCDPPSQTIWPTVATKIDQLELITDRPEGRETTLLTQVSGQLMQENKLRYFKDLKATYKTLALDGAWMWQLDNQQSHLYLKTNAQKAEHLAALFGLENSLNGGQIEASLFGHWQGGIDCLDTRTLTAKLLLSASDGALTETSPGLARLLGLLSFDAFTRRLKLGLSDLTSTGLVYDRLYLDANLSKGLLLLEDMQVSGPSITMKLSGHTDLVGETHQLKAQVTPLIGDSIPTLALLSGASPVTAIGVYLLQKIIPPLSGNILSFDYDITGAWQTPDLVTTDSKTAD